MANLNSTGKLNKKIHGVDLSEFFLLDVPLCRSFRVGLDNIEEIRLAGTLTRDFQKVTCKRCLKKIKRGVK